MRLGDGFHAIGLSPDEAAAAVGRLRAERPEESFTFSLRLGWDGLRTDTAEIETWVDEAIAANGQAVEEVTAGGKKQKKAFGFLMGQVMQKSRGAAQPDQVQRLLRDKLGIAD